MALEQRLREGIQVTGYHAGCGGEVHYKPTWPHPVCSKCNEAIDSTTD
ncbi:MAG: hypothetical protein RIF41_32305 [Polyangiaceae bacterium]